MVWFDGLYPLWRRLWRRCSSSPTPAGAASRVRPTTHLSGSSAAAGQASGRSGQSAALARLHLSVPRQGRLVDWLLRARGGPVASIEVVNPSNGAAAMLTL